MVTQDIVDEGWDEPGGMAKGRLPRIRGLKKLAGMMTPGRIAMMIPRPHDRQGHEVGGSTKGSIPRLLIAGTASGVGKTTVMVGLILALRSLGLRVAVFKCGPDYLDPTYHGRAADSPCLNLDGWMMGREAVIRTFQQGSRGADIALIEGVMGLFDGASATTEEGSAAEIAKWLGVPVLLVVDAHGMARSVAAVARGFAEFDPEVPLRGLLCNRVGSRGHLQLLREACPIPPILGGLPEEPRYQFPERHLGLRTADPDSVPDALLQPWGELVEQWVDVPSILDIARLAPSLPELPDLPGSTQSDRRGLRVGIAFDEAFHFYYADNLARLEAAGAELVRFSPIQDAMIPEVDGLYFGGGYPEIAAAELAANATMIASIHRFAESGGPIYAECGGLMYLARGIWTIDSVYHPMVGLIPGEVVVRDRLQALGYVEVVTRQPTIFGPAGLQFRGHQFRYSEFVSLPDHCDRRYDVQRRRTGQVVAEGYATRNVLASYIHAHWASNPEMAAGFVRTCEAARQRSMTLRS